MHCLLELAPGHPLKANHQHFKAQGQKERITVSSKKILKDNPLQA